MSLDRVACVLADHEPDQTYPYHCLCCPHCSWLVTAETENVIEWSTPEHVASMLDAAGLVIK